MDLPIISWTEECSENNDMYVGLSYIGLSTSDLMDVSQQLPESNELNSYSGESSGSQNVFECEVLSRPFPRESELKSHSCVQTGETSKQHSVCTESPDKSHLEKGHSTQTDKYKCTICNKSFSCISKLQVHNLRHIRVKGHQCKKCKKFLSTDIFLKSHYSKCRGKKCHHCEMCNKSFPTKSELDKHCICHTNNKYECLVCKKSFKWNSLLESHYVIHTGGKAHRCRFFGCTKSYKRESTLKRHYLVHGKIKAKEVRAPKSTG